MLVAKFENLEEIEIQTCQWFHPIYPTSNITALNNIVREYEAHPVHININWVNDRLKHDRFVR